MLQLVIFAIMGLLAVASGIAVFVVDSMARATYALAVSFVAVGVMLLQFNLDYLGVITILMMVMEMAIMAIFMIMFMGMNPALMPMDMVHNKRASLVIAVGSFVLLAAGALLVPWPARRGLPAADLTASLGEAVMGSKMLVMLTVSPVLFATLVAALVLANPRGRYDGARDDDVTSERAGDDGADGERAGKNLIQRAPGGPQDGGNGQ